MGMCVTGLDLVKKIQLCFIVKLSALFSPAVFFKSIYTKIVNPDQMAPIGTV